MKLVKKFRITEVRLCEYGFYLGITSLNGDRSAKEQLLFLDPKMAAFHNIQGGQELVKAIIETTFTWPSSVPPSDAPENTDNQVYPNDIVCEDIIHIETCYPQSSVRHEHYLMIKSQQEFGSCFASDPEYPYFLLKVFLSAEEFADCREKIGHPCGKIHLSILPKQG